MYVKEAKESTSGFYIKGTQKKDHVCPSKVREKKKEELEKRDKNHENGMEYEYEGGKKTEIKKGKQKTRLNSK